MVREYERQQTGVGTETQLKPASTVAVGLVGRTSRVGAETAEDVG